MDRSGQEMIISRMVILYLQREKRGRDAELLPEDPLTEITLSGMYGNALQYNRFVYICRFSPDGANKWLLYAAAAPSHLSVRYPCALFVLQCYQY